MCELPGHVHAELPGHGLPGADARRSLAHAHAGPRRVSELTLEEVRHKLPLMHACLNESMRFKPVGPVVVRQATKAVELHLGPGQGSLAVPQGGTVVVNLAAMHRDPSVFPAADKFDPVR